MPSQIWHSSGRPQKDAAWNPCKNVKWSHEKNSVYDDTICRDLDGYGDAAVYCRKNAHGQQPVFAADCRRFAVDFLLDNTAQSPPDGFARNLRADFPSYCPRQSAEKSDNAPYAQALCGVALAIFLRLWYNKNDLEAHHAQQPKWFGRAVTGKSIQSYNVPVLRKYLILWGKNHGSHWNGKRQED